MIALNKIENGRTADRMRNQWRNKALRKRGYVEREARARITGERGSV